MLMTSRGRPNKACRNRAANWIVRSRIPKVTKAWGIQTSVPEDTEVGVPSSGPEPETQVVEVPIQAEQVVEATGAVVAELNQRITDLTGDLARVREQLTREASEHGEDVERIGRFLMAKANDRGWCSEYDEGIEELNRRLYISLPVRRRDVEVTVSGYVRVPYSLTVTITVDGDTDDSDIEERAGEMVENNYAARTLVIDYADPYSAEVEDDMEFEFDASDN